MSVYEVKITHQAEIQMREIARYITVELKNPEAASPHSTKNPRTRT